MLRRPESVTISRLQDLLTCGVSWDGADTARTDMSFPRPSAWRPWRSKVVWAILIASIAFVRTGNPASRGPHPAFRNGIRAFNRRWVNPFVLRLAGNRPWGVARLEHRGRRSQELYATPVWADPVSEGFLIPMPYGQDVDWVKNLLHSGEGVLQHRGVRYQIGFPRTVAAARARLELPRLTRLFAGPFGIRSFLRVDVLRSLSVLAPPQD